MPLNIDVISTRVERRMAELARHVFQSVAPIGPWRVSTERPGDIPARPADDALLWLTEPGHAAEAGFADTVRLDAAVCHAYWASAEIVVPEALGDQEVWMILDTNAEALLYVNGELWQGVDPNRPEILLAGRGRAGETLRLDVMVWSGRDRTSKSVSGRLAARNKAIFDYRYDLQAIAGAARTQSPELTTTIRLWRTLEASLNAIDFHTSYGTADVSRAALVLREGVAEMRNQGHAPSEADLFCTGNSHIDVAWLWTLAETRQKMGRTTATALRYMDEYPDYQFAQSQAQLYAWLLEDFPELFEQVKSRVEDGRWHIAGPCWVEPDCNITGGEALIRQLLHGQGFWQKHFGFRAQTMWLPDTFGYAWALPQILRKSGIESFITQKLQWNDTNKMPHGIFLWEGVDGTRVPCIFPRTYTARALPEEMADWYRDFPSKHVAPAILYPYGFGDGGGGPVREDFEMIRRLNDVPGFPRAHHVPLQEGIDAVLGVARRWRDDYGQDLPVWKNELYLEFHRGTLTSNGATKRANRRSELLLREAEIWSVIAAVADGRAYPGALLDRAWKGVLLNQFHDILPGTSIAPVYDEAHRMYGDVRRAGEEAIAGALTALTRDAPEVDAVTVFNSTPWPVTDWVEVTLPGEAPAALVDADGRLRPVQTLESVSGGATRIGFEAVAPALGSVVYRFAEASEPAFDGRAPSAGDGALENDRFRIELAGDGTLVSALDKALDREWLAGPANVFQTFEDRPNSWEAWDINPWFEQKPLDLFRLRSCEPVESGPVRAGFRLDWDTPAGSRVEQRIYIYRAIPRIDFVTEVDWKEQRVLWKVAFPVQVHRSFATYDIQFGAIERPTGRSTSWEEGRFEVCAHRWTDLSEANGGVSLLNDCKYGHDIRDNVMRISLLRSPTHPDPREPHPPFKFLDDPNVFSDQGRHTIRYAFFPHAGDWRNGAVSQAFSFNNPLRAIAGAAVQLQGAEVTPEGVVLETLKRAEDGDGYILRVYEAYGGRYPCRVRLPFSPDAVDCVDLMEEPSDTEGPVTLDGATIRFDMKPFEIRTFRLRV